MLTLAAVWSMRCSQRTASPSVSLSKRSAELPRARSRSAAHKATASPASHRIRGICGAGGRRSAFGRSRRRRLLFLARQRAAAEVGAVALVDEVLRRAGAGGGIALLEDIAGILDELLVVLLLALRLLGDLDLGMLLELLVYFLDLFLLDLRILLDLLAFFPVLVILVLELLGLLLLELLLFPVLVVLVLELLGLFLLELLLLDLDLLGLDVLVELLLELLVGHLFRGLVGCLGLFRPSLSPRSENELDGVTGSARRRFALRLAVGFHTSIAERGGAPYPPIRSNRARLAFRRANPYVRRTRLTG